MFYYKIQILFSSFLQSNARSSVPNTSVKRHSNSASSNSEVKIKIKKQRLNSSTATSNSEPNLFKTLGLNHVNAMRKSNTLLDRPEVQAPVNKIFFFCYCIFYLFL